MFQGYTNSELSFDAESGEWNLHHLGDRGYYLTFVGHSFDDANEVRGRQIAWGDSLSEYPLGDGIWNLCSKEDNGTVTVHAEIK